MTSHGGFHRQRHGARPARTLVDVFGGREELRAGCIARGRAGPRSAKMRARDAGAAALRVFWLFHRGGDGAGPAAQRRRGCGGIAAERLREEMTKLLCGDGAAAVLLAYPEVIGVFLPEILPSVGFEQHNPHHCYTVWEHLVRSAAAVPPEPVLRWAMLLHDIGKPGVLHT